VVRSLGSVLVSKGLDIDDMVSGCGPGLEGSRSCGLVRRCDVVGSTLAFGSIGHGFESEHRLFSHHSASAFSKLRSLMKCSLDDSVR